MGIMNPGTLISCMQMMIISFAQSQTAWETDRLHGNPPKSSRRCWKSIIMKRSTNYLAGAMSIWCKNAGRL